MPTGILASGPGSISDVRISSTVESSYIYDGAGLFGIVIKTTADKTVSISNTTINLQLTTKYNPKETAVLRVCGIMNGSCWFEPTDNFKGYTIVRDCAINVTGIEGTDGAAIMVDGINVRGGGKIDVLGKTVITTSRKAGDFSKKGYEYSLNNENGIISVDADNVSFNKALTNGKMSVCDVESGDELKSMSISDLAGDDNAINFADFTALAQNWQKTGSGLAGDFDDSGKVDFNDLKILCDYWLAGTQPPEEVFDLFKTALAARDINKAVSYIAEISRDKYSDIFTAIEPNLPNFAAGMGQMTLIYSDVGEAKYEMLHQNGGQTYSFPVVFIREDDGNWKIFNF